MTQRSTGTAMARKPSWDPSCARALIPGGSCMVVQDAGTEPVWSQALWAHSETPDPPVAACQPFTSLEGPSFENIYTEYIFEWWIWQLGFKIAGAFGNSKDDCSVGDSSGLLSPVTALICGSQPVKWHVLVLWHWELFPSQPPGRHALSNDALGPAFCSPAARQDWLWIK